MPRVKKAQQQETQQETQVEELEQAWDWGEEIEPVDGDVEEGEPDINHESEIDSLLIRRPQGRPKGVLDYKLPVHPIEGEYTRSVTVAALTHLYYMQGHQFAPENVSLHHFQTLLDVSRHTVYRALDDVKEGKILALKLYAELRVMSENLHQAESARRRRVRQKMVESQSRVMQRRILERRLAKQGLMVDHSDEGEDEGEESEAPSHKIPAKRREINLSE